MGKLFCNPNPMTEEQLKKSRLALIVAECASNGASTVLMGQYLTSMMLARGLTEGQISLILGLPLFIQLLLLVVPYLAKKMTYRKPFVICCMVFEQLPVAVAFLASVIGITRGFFPAMTVFFCLYYVGCYLASPFYSQWSYNIAPKAPVKQSNYYGKKQTFCSMTNVGALLLVSLLGRKLEETDPELLFTLIGLIGLAFYLIKMTMFFFIGEEKVQEHVEIRNPLSAVKEILTCKSYRPYLIDCLCMSIVGGIFNPIITVYRQSRMGLSASYLSLLTVVGLILQIPFGTLWGKLAGKLGFRTTTFVGDVLCGISYLIHFFFTPETAQWLMIACILFSTVGSIGRSVASTPFLFECTPVEKRTVFLSFSSVLVSVVCYPLSLLTSAVVSAFGPDKYFTLFGLHITEMHVIIFISALIAFLIPILVRACTPKRDTDV